MNATKSIKVCSVKPAHSGFGMFQLGEAATVECETLDDYRGLCLDAQTVTRSSEADAAATDAHGRIYDQGSGVVIGWSNPDTDEITLECVYVV